MRIVLFLYILLIIKNVQAELLKPSPSLHPQEVISIQLNALKNNNNPYENAGIEQTWEFAHPSNRKFTGPLPNFKNMMYSTFYIIMLDHLDHNIILVNNQPTLSFFFIELTDKIGNQYGFQWTVEKVMISGEFIDCWMTTGVSRPIPLAKSA